MTSFRYLGSDWQQSAANFLLSLDQTLLLPLTVVYLNPRTVCRWYVCLQVLIELLTTASPSGHSLER